MNSQDLHNLQEAYMDVYELMERNERNPEKVEQQKTTHRKVEQNPSFFGGKKFGSLTGKMSKSPRNQKEQTDLYDIILSHLLDEGYADTQEQAEVIMVNMSEDWRESICEGFKKYPAKKVADKIDRMYNDPNTDIVFGDSARRRNEMMRVMNHMKGEVHPLIRSESPKKSKAKEKENRTRGVSDN